MVRKIIFRSCLIVFSGVPLSGKTVLAEKIASLSNFKRIDVDEIRNEIDESRKKDKQIRMLGPEEERAIMIKSYDLMCRRAEGVIRGRIPVIITGTFSRVEFKKSLESLVNVLKEENIPFKIFLVTAQDEEILKRIERRKIGKTFSNIDSLEKYLWAKGIFQKIEFAPLVEIDTGQIGHLDTVRKYMEDLEVRKIFQ